MILASTCILLAVFTYATQAWASLVETTLLYPAARRGLTGILKSTRLKTDSSSVTLLSI